MTASPTTAPPGRRYTTPPEAHDTMPANQHTKAQNELVASLVGADVDETVTNADVAEALAAAEAAEAEVEMLERRIEDGTDLTTTPEEFGQKQNQSRLARLFAKGAEARAERAARARRLRACDDLRREIEAYVGEAGSECSKLLRAVENAANAFVSKMDDRNRLIRAWHERAQNLGVGSHDMPLMPPKSDGHLATAGEGQRGLISGLGVVAGLRRVQGADPLPVLRGVLSGVRSETINPDKSVLDSGTVVEKPYELLGDLDGEFTPLPPETEFYRGENGGLFAFDPDKIPDTVRKTCTRVSRKEAEQR